MKILFTCTLFVAFLLCPAACAEGVRNGLSLAAQKALPALFPFFVISALWARIGLPASLSRFLARPLARLYRLPSAAAPAVLLGVTGGYPVGAATVSGLLQNGAISKYDAMKINCFCNCASPGFCIGLVGMNVFGSPRTGAILYFIHLIAALVTGIIIVRLIEEPVATTPQTSDTKPSVLSREGFAPAFCGAVQQAAFTALTVTAFLTMFSILIALLYPVRIFFPECAALSGLLELTNGLNELSSVPLPKGAVLTLSSFLLGFGGLAVHFQVKSIAVSCDCLTDGFFLAKVLHGVLAAAATALLFRFSPAALSVFAPIDGSVWYGKSMVLILCATFLLLLCAAQIQIKRHTVGK